jgi:hypothetical protein
VNWPEKKLIVIPTVSTPIPIIVTCADVAFPTVNNCFGFQQIVVVTVVGVTLLPYGVGSIYRELGMRLT